MRVSELCHKILSNTSIHQKRVAVLGEVVETVVNSKCLSVTQIGRRMRNGRQTRSNIRKADRLYGNAALMSEKEVIYHAIGQQVVTSKQPFIVIDGSKLPNSPWFMLRASLAHQGRAITLYELPYHLEEQGSLKLYRRFLQGLSRVLGDGIVPILITDAEFRGPWFRLVGELGWDFIGRVRGQTKVTLGHDEEAEDWRDLWDKASDKPTSLGASYYSQRHDLPGCFYLYLGPNQGRHAHTRSGRPSKTIKSLRHKASKAEPWLLFSSLDVPAKHIIKAYRMRMSIEENFRDTKSGRYGLGLKMTYSKQKLRYVVMLLVAALASLIAYLMGSLAELNHLHRQFQANSTKNKRVLSRFFLGCEMVYQQHTITYKQWQQTLKQLQLEIYHGFLT